jgi:hypothetical protein
MPHGIRKHLLSNELWDELLKGFNPEFMTAADGPIVRLHHFLVIGLSAFNVPAQSPTRGAAKNLCVKGM